jgi:hypothetical protein
MDSNNRDSVVFVLGLVVLIVLCFGIAWLWKG